MRIREKMRGKKNQVLVLNSDYQPINICTVRRAFNLILKESAELLHEQTGNPIVSGSYTFPRPSVIRLRKYVVMSFRKVKISKSNVFKRDNFTCLYCESKDYLTIDHVIPKSHGGLSTWENLATCCLPCNKKKGNKTPEEVGLKLAYKPYKPNMLIFLRDFNGILIEDWKQYMFV